MQSQWEKVHIYGVVLFLSSQHSSGRFGTCDFKAYFVACALFCIIFGSFLAEFILFYFLSLLFAFNDVVAWLLLLF